MAPRPRQPLLNARITDNAPLYRSKPMTSCPSPNERKRPTFSCCVTLPSRNSSVVHHPDDSGCLQLRIIGIAFHGRFGPFLDLETRGDPLWSVPGPATGGVAAKYKGGNR